MNSLGCCIMFLMFIFCIKASETWEAVLKLNISEETSNRTLQRIYRDYNLKFKHHLFDKYYVFETGSLNRKKRSTLPNVNQSNLDAVLGNDSSIKWHAIQTTIYRNKRGMEMEEEVIYELNDYIRQLNSQIEPTEASKCRKSRLALNDPEWINQWYMNEGCEQGFTLNKSFIT